MRLAMPLAYAAEPLGQVDIAVACERAGLDAVWVAEAWGYDAPSIMGFLAARTERVLIGAGILPVYTRTPALIAQTAAGVDALSGGRCMLGLGTSGPQVVEGFHGVPFDMPLARLRETVSVCRTVWAREPLTHEGRAFRIPPAPGEGTGLGRTLRLLTHPPRARIPIHLATLTERAVALTAEVADGWLPLFFVPERAAGVWGDALRAGAARRHDDLAPLLICAGAPCAVGDGPEVIALRDRARPELALYIGGMGARGHNFYNELFARFGWADAARRVQDLYLDGHRAQAEAALPDDLVAAATLCGPAGHVRERVAAYREAGVGMLNIRPLGSDPVATVAAMRTICDEVS